MYTRIQMYSQQQAFVFVFHISYLIHSTILTYIVFPHDFVGTRIRMNFAFEVYIITFLDVIRVHIRAEL